MSLTLPQLWALLEASDPDNKSDQNEATATSFSDAMTKAREQLNNAT